MNGQTIPGFYWDPEKKKYFKIQSATASRDLNLKYSAQNIRRAEREERVQSKITSQTNKTRRERVIRRHVNHLTQSNLEREIGFKRRSFYVHDVWPNACMHGISTRAVKAFDKAPSLPIRRFTRDPVSKTIYAVHGGNSIKRRRIRPDGAPPLPNLGPDVEECYSFERWEELQRTTSTVSSLSYLPATGALATTTYGSDRPPVVYLSDPDVDGPYVGQQFTPKGCAAIWDAAARPITVYDSPTSINSVAASSVEHLAVAASNSMLLFTRSQDGSWDMKSPLKSLETDILALTWLSPSTVALGSRNGKIRLYDTRSGGSSHILTHPNAISRLKRADDQTRLVVSGLQDSLFLYDIRAPRISNSSCYPPTQHYNDEYFSNLYPDGSNAKKRRKKSHTAYKHWSQPILAFPHSNVDDLQLGIDVHARLGLVAAAQSQESAITIRVCNLWTGKILKDIKKAKGIPASVKDCVRCVKFVDEGDEEGVAVWANWHGYMARFAW